MLDAELASLNASLDNNYKQRVFSSRTRYSHTAYYAFDYCTLTVVGISSHLKFVEHLHDFSVTRTRLQISFSLVPRSRALESTPIVCLHSIRTSTTTDLFSHFSHKFYDIIYFTTFYDFGIYV